MFISSMFRKILFLRFENIVNLRYYVHIQENTKSAF